MHPISRLSRLDVLYVNAWGFLNTPVGMIPFYRLPGVQMAERIHEAEVYLRAVSDCKPSARSDVCLLLGMLRQFLSMSAQEERARSGVVGESGRVFRVVETTERRAGGDLVRYSS